MLFNHKHIKKDRVDLFMHRMLEAECSIKYFDLFVKANQILIVICLFYVISFGYVDFPLWIKLSKCFTIKVVVNWMIV